MTVKDAGTNINIHRQGIPSGHEIHLTKVPRSGAPPGHGGEKTVLQNFVTILIQEVSSEAAALLLK